MTVEFLQPVFPVGEGQENVSVCLTIDAPIATPLTVSLEAISLSADGKSINDLLQQTGACKLFQYSTMVLVDYISKLHGAYVPHNDFMAINIGSA